MLQCAHNLKKNSLAQQLDNAASAESCLSIITEYLSGFAVSDGETIKSFKNPRQAAIACEILNIYIFQIARLSNMFKNTPVQTGTEPAAFPKIETTEEANHADGTILGIGSAAIIGGLMANPIVGVPLALAGGLLASKLTHSSEEPRQEMSIPNPTNVSQTSIQFYAQYILDGLESLFNSIDVLAQGIEDSPDAGRHLPLYP
jgi:hypothetical protein